MPRLLRPYIFILLGGLVLLPFQNCGQAYRPSADMASSSAQCRAMQIQSARASRLPASRLACEDLGSYQCEQRIFAPDVVSGVHDESFCRGASCVQVTARVFNTDGARSGAMPAQLAPGGDYNHVETRCYHRYEANGEILFEEAADELGDALNKTMALCRSLVEGA